MTLIARLSAKVADMAPEVVIAEIESSEILKLRGVLLHLSAIFA